MAFEAKSDLYQVMRFEVRMLTQVSPFPAGYFQSCTTPEYSVEAQDFRDGLKIFPIKQPGLVTTNDLTLVRGIVLGETGLWSWMEALLTNRSYKADLRISHYHRTAFQKDKVTEILDYTKSQKELLPRRDYIIYAAMPIRLKVSSDLSAISGEFAVEELAISYEYFDVQLKS